MLVGKGERREEYVVFYPSLLIFVQLGMEWGWGTKDGFKNLV